jgi:hypothetical protein
LVAITRGTVREKFEREIKRKYLYLLASALTIRLDPNPKYRTPVVIAMMLSPLSLPPI